MPEIIKIAIGFLAQGFFSARILVQWIMSERAHKVLSPTIFWVFSLLGSCLLCFYGWLRDDFSIILGQFISYYVYIWNLKRKGILLLLPKMLNFVLLILPVVAAAMMLQEAGELFQRLFQNSRVPLWLIVFGSLGQVIFTLRFVYQWWYSRGRGESLLPKGFWIMSLVGSLTIVSYGVMRGDIVLIVGQSTGVVAYTRNLFLGKGRQTNKK